MKEIRNYKNIRRKPQIWGFTPEAFYLAMGIAIVSLVILATTFTWTKLIIVAVINLCSVILTKIFMSNNDFLRKMLDEKFPDEISPLTRNFKTKTKKENGK